jgi:subtilisin family serine protease
MDTGVDASHEDLDVFQGVTFTDLDLDDFSAGDHGTHVAGTMAAKDNTAGVVGVAPDCFLIDAKVFNSSGGASDGDIIEAVVYCTDRRFHVINMSFGDRVPSPPFEPQREAIFDFINSGVSS